jgi:hypothetical protein
MQRTPLLDPHSRDLDVDVNSIENWPRNALLILGNDSSRTRTGFLCIIKISARAGMYIKDSFHLHATNQKELLKSSFIILYPSSYKDTNSKRSYLRSQDNVVGMGPDQGRGNFPPAIHPGGIIGGNI